jgi:Diaminopimelate epimerase
MNLEFTKMNGAGNDFVMVDNRGGSRSLNRDQIAALCDRHRGIGGDGLIAVEGTPELPQMRYYNADGGEAEMCPLLCPFCSPVDGSTRRHPLFFHPGRHDLGGTSAR